MDCKLDCSLIDRALSLPIGRRGSFRFTTEKVLRKIHSQDRLFTKFSIAFLHLRTSQGLLERKEQHLRVK